MKTNQPFFPARLLVCIGLLMVTMPMLFKTYIYMPDFLRGVLAGAGIVFEFTGLIMMKRNGSRCSNTLKTDTLQNNEQ